MTIEELQKELNFDEEAVEDSEEVTEAQTFPVVGMVVTDRKIKLSGF
ncbi:unnamed protein product [Cuscuta epithymum]|uniref:Uncharacterized protein n=1 Tax=Cuscuta epithymum TaxID=186058 RepID=A0AAV0G0B3_9ASTE|nr:unnamed protein product [Cuscuta epithymum]